jgi:hypothetical protein
VQAHGAPEGIYAHQGAHIFFAASLALLIYWLRQRQLVKETGWRRIQYSAFFFILWNIGAFAAHLMDEQWNVVGIQMVAPWMVKVDAEIFSPVLAWVYYAAKLDHLICVPALLFLYAGLRRLLKDAAAHNGEADAP